MDGARTRWPLEFVETCELRAGTSGRRGANGQAEAIAHEECVVEVAGNRT